MPRMGSTVLHDLLARYAPTMLTSTQHTSTYAGPVGRRGVLAGGAAALAGCTPELAPRGPTVMPAGLSDDAFTMPDGARLPYRAWLPAGRPHTVALALHGFNDSRDAWEIPAPAFAAAGIAVYAPDQRGFGAAPGRGVWPGAEALVADASTMAGLVRARHPGAKLVLMGESMGGAVLMRLGATNGAPEAAGFVLLAPAVWGRARMNVFLRSTLWLAANLAPGMVLEGGGGLVRVRASDNYEALLRLSRDPLTLHGTRVDTLRGLVDLMDLALASGPAFEAPGLFLYGGKDELVPKEATAATWRSLPPRWAERGGRTAFYPGGYHLLFRDLGRQTAIADAIAWIADRAAPLPSQGDTAARAWLAAQT